MEKLGINLKLSDIKNEQQYLYIWSKLKDIADFLQIS